MISCRFAKLQEVAHSFFKTTRRQIMMRPLRSGKALRQIGLSERLDDGF